MPDIAHREPRTAQRLLDEAKGAVEMALAAGADDAVAGVSTERGLEFRWRDGSLENAKENASRGLGISLYVDGRYSMHSTNDLEPSRLKAFLEEAVALTRHLEPDPFRVIPDPKLYEGRADVSLDLVDPAVLELSRRERIDWCRRMEERAKANDLVVSTTSQVHDAHDIAARASSNGFEGTHEVTQVVYGAQVALREGETRRPEDHWFVYGTHVEGLPGPGDVGAEALRRALSRLGSKKVSSRRTKMVLHPEAAASLMGRMLGALSAGAVQQRRSFLADKKDQRIASEILTITDDPFLPKGLGSRLFDAEGIASKVRPVVENGVLRNYFVDTYYGRKLGWEPTSGRATNLVFRHGEKDLAGIVADLEDAILVTAWVGGNADPTSGAFSYGVRGHVIQGGQIEEPISEMNVTGSFLDLLGRLVLMGNDPVPWYACRTPTLVFDDVQFSGS